MPIVTIQMLEGRSSDQKRELIKTVTRSITDTLDIHPERVRVILEEMPFDHDGIAGLPVLEFRKQTDQD